LRAVSNAARGVALALLCALAAVAASGTPALAAGDANASSCPNESLVGFREYLPDCRAYEQVSPVFKGGTQLLDVRVSEDGSQLIGATLGVFAGSGSDNASAGSEYRFSRAPSGWGVAGLSPPAASFPGEYLIAASPDLDQTLWLARSPAESIAAANFFVRESDGAMAEIGPLLPPSVTGGPPAEEVEGFQYDKDLKFLEASNDFSHVVFDPTTFRWPGDSTVGERSLYEYSGRGESHPELVGMNDAGRLITSCETYLGSKDEGDDYNAVSADGSSVFFTAEACSNHPGEPVVNELYGRLGGFPVDTIAISEPTFSACEECQTGVASLTHPAVVEQPAEFAGASQDGSNVFFLTSQELFAGDKGENLFDYDFDNPEGHKIVQVSTGSSTPEVQGVVRVSEDGSHVYFVAGGRLTNGPREGETGRCLAELTPLEQAEELTAREQEAKSEAVTAGARCRPKEGTANLYVFERDASYPAGRVAFIATLSSEDAADWSGTDGRPVQATPDGRFLVFKSEADATPGDTSTVPQIFEYDTLNETLTRVSRGATDYEEPGTESADAHQSAIPIQSYYSGPISPAGATTGLVVSADGSTVVFESSAALTAEALPASKAAAESGDAQSGNVYEYHSSAGDGGSIADGDVHLISDGVNKFPVALEGLDRSGEDIFFQTADALVPQDTDTQYDIYDARVNGGFPAPDPPPACEGCEATSLVQPPPSPGAAAVPGPGELVSTNTSPLIGSRARQTPAELRAEEYARALKLCKRDKSKSKRGACERRARDRYRVKIKVRQASRRAK
jgi:hypothetical protein